jgi:TIR domain
MAARVFISYAHADETFREQLDKQLSILKRAGIVEIWHDRRLVAGEEWDHGIKAELEHANIILLLVSPDFIASDYINDVEIARAMERHESGSACVIPVILRHCAWNLTTFAKLQALPKNAKPVAKWADMDEALLDIVNGIKRSAERLGSKSTSVMATVSAMPRQSVPTGMPRSGNLRVTKRFTDQDKDAFKHEAFEFVSRYIEGSLAELSARHNDLRTTFRPIDANRFTAVIYRGGTKVSACTVSLGSMMGDILYSSTEIARDNSCNESLSVKNDDQALFLEPMGMSMMYSGGGKDKKLSMEGGAELYWGLLIQPLQND